MEGELFEIIGRVNTKARDVIWPFGWIEATETRFLYSIERISVQITKLQAVMVGV